MSTSPRGPRPYPKPVLSAPSFKYGGVSYVALAYAKVRGNKPFGVENLVAFSARFSKPSDAKRAIDTLVKNGSITEVKPGLWVISNKGRQQVLDFAARRKVMPASD